MLFSYLTKKETID